jgi:phage pi2 protein 07
VFWNRRLLYRRTSIKRYNEIRNILELNNIKYTLKMENKGYVINKIIIGTLRQSEDFSY